MLHNEAVHIARSQRLQIVGAQQHAGNHGTRVDSTLEIDPTSLCILHSHTLHSRKVTLATVLTGMPELA